MLGTSMYGKRILFVILLLGVLSACSKSDHEHTTVLIPIPPPPRQLLTVVSVSPQGNAATATPEIDPTADAKKPLLLFHLENGRTFRTGEAVTINFSVLNAKLKGEGGDFRVRYIVDDDEMKWLDTSQPLSLAGWIQGKHTIRIELIGPDGWPYKNGNANIVTREITVVKA